MPVTEGVSQSARHPRTGLLARSDATLEEFDRQSRDVAGSGCVRQDGVAALVSSRPSYSALVL
ncbi:hypothetical protein ABZW47_31225 [Streptomyces sp. NPDC004549]|uniref:hypothetical protein n=1 Tax=Streptomyces sp. NPDC004549 TaxID=3154283 RepID=UPI0033BCC678